MATKKQPSGVDPIPFALPFTRYFSRGYQPIPIVWGEKRPAGGRRWNTRAYDYELLDRGKHSVGILCGTVIGLDIDITDPKLADEIDLLVCNILHLSDPVRRVGLAPKRLLVARCDSVVSSWDIRKDGRTLFQLLGKGKQFVVHGIHPDTGRPYTLSKPLPKVTRLPLVNGHDLNQLRLALSLHLGVDDDHSYGGDAEYDESLGDQLTRHRYTTTPWDQDDIREYVLPRLRSIPPDTDRPTWIQVGLALDAGSHHSDDMLDLYNAWSRGELHGVDVSRVNGSGRKPKYAGIEDVRAQWRSFKPGRTGTGTLDAIARRYGFEDTEPTKAPRFEQKPNDFIDNSKFFTTAARIRDEDHPEDEEFIHNFLQVGATLLHGPSKHGKSWLALEACEAVAMGKESFLGLPVTQAKALIVGAEDPPRRFMKRLDIMGIPKCDDLILMTRADLKKWEYANRPTGGWTPENLITTLYDHTGARVIVLDTAEVIEARLNIVHGNKGDSVTRRDYLSTANYDEVASAFKLAVVLVAHWGAIKSVPLAALNPHEMINTTKAKLNGVLTSIALGPLPNQELDDKSGASQLAIMGKDLSSGKQFWRISRRVSKAGEYIDWRTTLEGDVKDVQLRESFAEVMRALESLDGKANSKELGDALGMRPDTLRKKMISMRQQAEREGRELVWKDKTLRSSSSGYELV